MTAPTATRDLAANLDSIVLLVRTAQLVAADRLAGMDPADRVRLDYGLDMARRAITESQTPARQASSRLAAVAGGPDRAGGPPAPGAGTFSLPQPQEFQIGIGPLYDALPSVPWPGRPFPVYEVPAP